MTMPTLTQLQKQKTCQINFKWKVFDHPPYSPDFASSDFHLIAQVEELIDKKQIAAAVTNWLNGLAVTEYYMGIQKLMERYDKGLNMEGWLYGEAKVSSLMYGK